VSTQSLPRPSVTQTLGRPANWSPRLRANLVLRVLRGELSLDEAAAITRLPADEIRAWRERFLAGAAAAFADAPPAPGPRVGPVCETIADAVGGTPLVRLNACVPVAADAWAKVEFTNPMGSIKDRVARHLVAAAARDGRLAPGATIVEASSGNTAMGLGMMAVLGGYRCRVAVRDRTSREKLDSLRALGVDLELVEASLPPEHPDSYNRVVQRLVAETAGAYYPDQHNNRENNRAHYETTGPELWAQMDGRVDVLVAGVGTGGTLSGVARYLKERDPSVRVVAVDVEGSVFTEYFRHRRLGRPGPYRLEGLGDEELIECVEWDLIDDMVQVSDGEAFRAARELAAREAILAGGSSGAALVGVRRVAERLGGRPARVATIFPDGASRYLTTIYSDDWMRAHGYLE